LIGQFKKKNLDSTSANNIGPPTPKVRKKILKRKNIEEYNMDEEMKSFDFSMKNNEDDGMDVKRLKLGEEDPVMEYEGTLLSHLLVHHISNNKQKISTSSSSSSATITTATRTSTAVNQTSSPTIISIGTTTTPITRPLELPKLTKVDARKSVKM